MVFQKIVFPIYLRGMRIFGIRKQQILFLLPQHCQNILNR